MTRMFSMIFVILFFFIMVLCAFQPICFAHAVETGDSLTLSVKLIEFGSNKIYLMLDNDTPLTPRYIRDNPDYKVYISCTGNFSVLVNVAVGNSYGSCGVWRGSNANTLYEFSYSNVETMDTYVNKYSDYLDSPIYITCGHNNPIFTINSNVKYNDETEPSEPTEPEETEPVVPPEDGGEDTAGLLDSLLNGIKEFFSDLFSPILSFIEDVQETFSSTDKLLGWFNSLYEKIKGYTMKPVLDFFEDLTQNDAVALVLLFWDFPFVKEFTLAVVAVLIVSGLFRLLNSL